MAFQGDSIFWVEVDKIVPNPFQPRREFNEDKLKELSESIRMYGILQPLTVTRKEIQQESGAFFTEYELIAGERRLRASKLAQLVQVPVIIRDGEDTEQEKLELAIIENLQREDLNAVDRALAFQQLADAFELSHAEVAKKVGRSREYVSNSIRLLGLPQHILDSLKVGDVSEGHARTLLMLKDRLEEQDVVYREILLKKLSVREVERIVRKIASDKVRKKKWKDTDPQLIEFEKEFTDALGTRVQIAKTDYGGKLTIDYFSEEDLQKLLGILKSESEGQAEEEVPGAAPVIRSMKDMAAGALSALSAATPLVSQPSEKEEVVSAVDTDGVSTASAVTQSPAAAAVINEAVAETAIDEVAAASEVREEMVMDQVDHQVVMNQPVGITRPQFVMPQPEPAPTPSVEPVETAVHEQINELKAHEEAKQDDATVSTVEKSTETASDSGSVSTETGVSEEKEKDDDTDLYSMRNFSL